MSVIGNIIVSLGWFGANLIYPGLHSYGTRFWTFLVVAVVSKA